MGEQIVQFRLLLLLGSQFLGLVFLTTRNDEGRVGGGHEAADAKVVVEGRQDLGAVGVDHDLESGLGHEEDVLGPGEAAVLEVVGDLGIVQGGDLQVDVPDIGGHANHVGYAQLVTSGESTQNISSLECKYRKF